MDQHAVSAIPMPRSWRKLAAVLSRADFLDAGRTYVMARAAAIGIVVSVLALVLTAHRGADHNGTVPGGDFVAYWVAAGLARAGHAASAYLPDAVYAAEHRAVSMPADAFLPFYYPPVWLVLLLPFSALPYVASWLAFCATTGAAFLLTLRRLLPRSLPGIWLGLLGFPGLLVNAGNGQNGFVTATCFAAYGVLLDRRPFLAGMALGCLSFKPQFALAVPVALLAARRVRPLLGAALSGALLVAASLAVFGTPPWHGFAAALPMARPMFERGLLFPFKVISVLGGMRMIGLPGGLAYAVQAAASLAALSVLAWASWKRPGGAREAGLLAGASLLVTPYAMDYDLPVAAVAMAALFSAGLRTGFRPWEKITLLLAYMLPLLGPAVARGTSLPIAPLVLAALFLLSARRSANVHAM